MNPPVLVLDHVAAAYGPYRALFDVSFSVPEQGAVALVGANGAGKSTLARVVSGLVRPTAGRVRFAGTDLRRTPAWRIARLGLAHVPEGRGVFASLDVDDNLRLALVPALGRRRGEEAVDQALAAFPRLADRRHRPAGTLSGGEQRLLAIARHLVRPARLLVLDEVSAGLSPAATADVVAALDRLHAAGTALLLVEHHLGRVSRLADRVVRIDRGRVLDGPPDGPQAGPGETPGPGGPAGEQAPAGPGGPAGQEDSGSPGTSGPAGTA